MPDSIICGVSVCDRPATKRGWCEGHYTRWRKTGDSGSTALRPQRDHHYERGNCSVPGCGLVEHCKGYCRSHYVRLRKTGSAGESPLGQQFKSTDYPDGTRVCNTCGERKPLPKFYAAKNCELGRRATCIKCCQSRGLARRSEVPEIYAATSARRRARKSAAVMDTNLSHAALRLRDGDLCYYCGVVMSFAAGQLGVWVPTKASIEHLLPLSRGGSHSFENTVLACLQCNVRKHNKTPEEWQASAC